MAADDVSLAGSLAEADAEQRRLRPELDVGIGGSRNPGKLKCLHAHVAYLQLRYLTRPQAATGRQAGQDQGCHWSA